jgi:hypothetical protein
MLRGKLLEFSSLKSAQELPKSPPKIFPEPFKDGGLLLSPKSECNKLLVI